MTFREPTQEELAAHLQQIVESPSYRLAYRDSDFLGRVDSRPLRLQMELLKPELLLQENGVTSMVVCFGGTQVMSKVDAEGLLDQASKKLACDPENQELLREVTVAKAKVKKSRYYEDCRTFAQIVSTRSKTDVQQDFLVCTGGGPGIMEAGNRGAYEVGARSVGLNITLPFEQVPNSYVTPELCFQFNYFALRKMHFLFRAMAIVCFPGGFGTLDELFTALTLRQTLRMQAIPIILYGKDYWNNVINFQFLADEGVIRDDHMDLLDYADTPEECWKIVVDWYMSKEND